MTDEPVQSPPHLTLREEDEQLSEFLLGTQRFLMKHPHAAREVITGLLEEGRRFAQTPEGQRWMDALANTELVKRSLLIWEAYGLDMLLETRPSVTPSTWLDMIVAVISNPDLEGFLSMLLMEEMRSGKVSFT
jgi:hypothetical protein